MASYTGTVTGASFYGARVFLRDDDGAPAVPAGTATGTAWPGLKVHKARALTTQPAEPQRLQARGDGRTFATFVEPPTDTPSGELRAQTSDVDLIAMLTGVKDFGCGYRHMAPLATDKVGSESSVLIFGWRKAVDANPASDTYGQTMWHTRFILNGVAYYQPDVMEDGSVGEPRWNIVANSSSTDMFGRAMTTAIHGCTEASFVEITSPYKVQLDVFVGDGSQTEFTLSQGANVVSDANNPVQTFVDGVEVANSVSDLGVVTIATLADSSKLCVLYAYDA